MHVAVLGAGYAGLTLARRLERTLPAGVDLTLVDESPDHLLQHELHRVVRRPSLADEITVSLPDAFDRADVRIARVESIDRDERVVHFGRGSLSYDVCAVCLGAETAYYGLAGVRERATPLKRLNHALRIRADALDVIDGAERGARSRIVVGGAGLSGVQVAGELAELVREERARAPVEVCVLEQFESVAPGFPGAFRRAVRDALEALGVEIRTETTVTDADAERIALETADGTVSDLPYDQFVWTGGIEGAAALSGDRPRVGRDLRLDERTFALGDAARVVDAEGEPAPPSAQTAIRQAGVAAKNVTRVVDHELDSSEVDFAPHLQGYTYESPGWLVSVGDDAVAQVGPTVLTGRAARAMKATVGVGYLSSVGALGEAADLALEEFRIERECGRH